MKQETFDYKSGNDIPQLKEKTTTSKPVASNMTFDEKMRMFNQDFIIPQTPSGKTLHFNILSTWGDVNYVGLTGIEIFSTDGK